MKSIFKLFVVMLCFLCDCGYRNNILDQGNDDIIIYQIIYGKSKYEKITGIACIKGLIYYLPNDSNLLTYKTLPKNAELINDKELIKIFNNLNQKEIASIKDYGICNCKMISQNEYIIRFIKDGLTKDFIFTEIYGCKTSSSCKFIEDIYYSFRDISFNNSLQKKNN